MREKTRILLINLFTFLFLITLLEVALYVPLRKPSYIPSFLLSAYRNYYQTSDRQIIQVTDCGQYDSTLFYILKPGTCTFSNREFTVTNAINRAGLRDDEQSLENPSIIFLGDSYTLGWGVQQEESFPQLVEQFSGQRVLNAGMSSYGTAREMKLLERLNLQKVKYIFLQYHENDHEENLTALSHHYKLPIRSKFSYDSLKKQIDRRQQYFPFKNIYGITKSFAKNLIPQKSKYTFTEADEAKTFLDVLLNANVKTDGIKFFVFKADYYDKLSDGFADAIDSLLQTTGYSSLNMKTIRITNTLSEQDYFVLDDHINANGHKKIAAKLLEHLQHKTGDLVIHNDEQ